MNSHSLETWSCHLRARHWRRKVERPQRRRLAPLVMLFPSRNPCNRTPGTVWKTLDSRVPGQRAIISMTFSGVKAQITANTIAQGCASQCLSWTSLRIPLLRQILIVSDRSNSIVYNIYVVAHQTKTAISAQFPWHHPTQTMVSCLRTTCFRSLFLWRAWWSFMMCGWHDVGKQCWTTSPTRLLRENKYIASLATLKEDMVDSPIHADHIHSGDSTTLFFIKKRTNAVDSFFMRSTNSSNTAVPPEDTTLAFRSLRCGSKVLLTNETVQ